jgi:hypothetical protein
MKRVGRILKTIFWIVTVLAMLAAGTAATYAWFTSNRVVSTDSVSGRSGSDTVELQISSAGGSSFRGSQESSIVQVNQTTATSLMPVSTADLATFVYSPGTVDDMASNFQVVDQEKYYYHGRVYLQAVADGQASGARMALYLDQGSSAGGALAQNDSGNLLNAARLGLTFDSADAVIFRLSDSSNASGNQVRNTQIGGQTLGDNQVLSYSGGSVKAVSDPAVSLDAYTITMTDTAVELPDQPLFYLELNRIYTVDIYFYLEGCDPDCSDSISYDGADLHLAFYGILA